MIGFRFPADFDVGEVSAYTMWQLFIHDLGEYLEGMLNVVNFSKFSILSSFPSLSSTFLSAFLPSFTLFISIL